MRRSKKHINRADRLALGGYIADAYFFLQDLELAYLSNGVKYMDKDIQFLPKLYDLCENLRNEIKPDVDKFRKKQEEIDKIGT